MYVKAKRSHSMPNRFILPSADMGEYEEGSSRRRSAPSGPLYPLREEGRYGAPPRAPAPPPAPLPGYQPRERKPKVYSSYAVDTGCHVHSKKLAKTERDHGSVDRRKSSFSSTRSRASPAPSNYSSGRRTVSASPARATASSERSTRSSSYGRNSASPDPSSAAAPHRKLSGRNSGGYSTTSWSSASSTSSTYSNKYGSNSGKYRSDGSSNTASSKYRSGNSNNLRDSSFEENEEYEYEENQRRASVNKNKGYGDYMKDIDSGMNGISLDSMRKPKVNSWDSMGILGLSNKMWSDHRKRSENFMASTGHFLREDNYGTSYIM